MNNPKRKAGNEWKGIKGGRNGARKPSIDPRSLQPLVETLTFKIYLCCFALLYRVELAISETSVITSEKEPR
jgi:hypothetical protein